MQEVAIFSAPVADYDLDIARVREDWKLVVRPNTAAAIARSSRAVRAVSPDSRCA